MEILFVVFLFGVAWGGCFNDDLRRLDSIRNEDACLMAGGICTIAVDCPKHQLAKQGLCPQQQNDGVECCYGLSVRETRCSRRGGECAPKHACNPRLIAKEATDCELYSVCCI